MSESLDIYDDNVQRIGAKDREAVHASGDWHKAFHCWIVAEREDQPVVLFQLRGPDKKVFPNKLDITAAGHLVQGESVEDGLRELEEELGVTVDFDRLIPLGLRTEVVQLGDVINREFDETFLLHDNRALQEYKLQEEEVTGLAEIGIDEGQQLFGGDLDSVTARAIMLNESGTSEEDLRVTVDSVIPRTDRYYLKVFIMAARYFAGERYLAI